MNGCRGDIWVITGERGVGKTRFCMELLKKARADGINVAGIISPPVFIDGIKQLIEIENVKTGDTKTLASRRTGESEGIFTHRWAFDEEALNWGDEILAHATPCELLFVDELGPLEFNRGEGLLNGLKAVDSRNFDSAVVVIRPELILTVTNRWSDSKILDVPPFMDSNRTNEFLTKILS